MTDDSNARSSCVVSIADLDTKLQCSKNDLSSQMGSSLSYVYDPHSDPLPGRMTFCLALQTPPTS